MTMLSIACLPEKKGQARITWWNFNSCLVIGQEWWFAYFKLLFMKLAVTL